jgi:hypothetical protein
MPSLWDDATLPYAGQDQQPQDTSSLWGWLSSTFGGGQPFKSNNPALDAMMLGRDLPGPENRTRYRAGDPALDPALQQYQSQPQPLGSTLMDLASTVAPYLVGGAPAGSLSAGIRAYHGSPYDFPAFDINKIGTGEGAQAYGHGLYFAENEAVARGYRNQLTGSPKYSLIGPNDEVLASNAYSPTTLGLTMADRLRDVMHPDMPYLRTSIGRLWAEGKPLDVDSVMDDAFGPMRGAVESANANYNFRGPIEDSIAGAKPILEQHRIETTQPGRMYEVNINADPEHFLDWDKPLSEQSEHVKQALRGLPWGEPYAESGTLTDSQIVPRTAEGMQQLRDAGIPGIRYLDAFSRRGGQGTSNYVMFDPSTIDILRKYGVAGLLGGTGAATIAGQSNQ